jgi:hypothetical protein
VRYGARYTLKQRGRGAFPDVAEAIMIFAPMVERQTRLS